MANEIRRPPWNNCLRLENSGEWLTTSGVIVGYKVEPTRDVSIRTSPAITYEEQDLREIAAFLLDLADRQADGTIYTVVSFNDRSNTPYE